MLNVSVNKIFQSLLFGGFAILLTFIHDTFFVYDFILYLGKSLNFNEFFGNVFPSQSPATMIQGVIVAPILEEFAKGFVIFLVLLFTKSQKSVYAGFVIGTMTGFGFECIEEVKYLLDSFQHNGLLSALLLSLKRNLLFLGFTCHIFYSCIIGLSLGYALSEKQKIMIRLGLVFIAFALAVLLHSIHNFYPYSNVLLGIVYIFAWIKMHQKFRTPGNIPKN